MKSYPYEIISINCNLCESVYTKAKNSYIQDECVCFRCFSKKHYDPKKENETTSLSDLLLKKPFTHEQAYLLGRLYIPFVWSEQDDDDDDETIAFNFNDDNVNSVNLLKMMLLCTDVFYNQDKEHHNFTFNKSTLTELYQSFNVNKLDIIFKSNEKKVLFLRGITESYGSLITSVMSLKITLKAHGILGSLKNINTNVTEGENYLIYEKLNCLDFLGKIYNNHLYLVDSFFYKQYVLTISTYSASKTSFSYCKVLKNDDNAIIPFKTNLSDIGFDLTIIKKVKDLTSNTVLYDTGIIVEPPKGFYIEIHPRSSLSKSGYILANSTGIIDPGYRNTLMIALTKTDQKSPNIELPFKCCQMIIKRHELIELVEVMDINSQTSRGLGGFGSTG